MKIKIINRHIIIFCLSLFVTISEAQEVSPPGVARLLENKEKFNVDLSDRPKIILNEKESTRKIKQYVDDKNKVLIRGVIVSGVSRIKDKFPLEIDELDFSNVKLLNIEEMKKIANAIEYRLKGYGFIFAKAWLPAQDLSDGILNINVILGEYGDVKVGKSGNNFVSDEIIDEVTPWIKVIKSGDLIERSYLHRRLLLINELPGLQVSSTLKIGDSNGKSDLHVNVDSFKKWRASVSYDNYGNHYAGKDRILANLDFHPSWVFGDNFKVNAMRTSESTLYAEMAYSIPLGVNGLRLHSQLGRTEYRLGKEFASLQAHGSADILYVGIDYPLVKSPTSNLQGRVGIKNRSMHDIRDAVLSHENKKSSSINSQIEWNLRTDKSVSLLGIGWVAGSIKLSDKQLDIDRMSAQTSGDFHRLNLDAIHLHALSRKWNVYFRSSAQWSNKNLDDSEKISLGGAYGVRGWPSGEAVGDQGISSQFELRYRAYPSWEAYALVDAGSVQVNKSPWSNINNKRNIYSKGLGVRYEGLPLKIDFSWSRRNGESKPMSYPGSNKNIFLFNASYFIE